MQPEAEAKLAALKQEAAKGKEADDGVIAKLVDGLVELVPGAASAVVSAFATPILGGYRRPGHRLRARQTEGQIGAAVAPEHAACARPRRSAGQSGGSTSRLGRLRRRRYRRPRQVTHMHGSTAEEIVSDLEKRGLLAAAELAGLQRAVIIKLAQRLKPEAVDFNQAVRELESAVGVAMDVIRAGRARH